MIWRALRRHQAVAVISFLTAVHLTVTLIWLQWDRTLEFLVPDSFLYFANFFQLRTGLELGGLHAALAFLRALNSHYSFLSLYPPVLFSLLFDQAYLAGRAGNVLYFVVLLASVYKLGLLCHGRRAGLLAAALVSLMPAVHGGWHNLGVDFPALCLTPLAILLLLRSRGFTNLRASLAFGAVAGATILLKAQCVFFLVPPAAYMLAVPIITRLRGRGPTPWGVLARAAACVATVLAVTAVWWGGRAGGILDKMQIHSTGQGMLFYEGDISLWGGVTYYLGSLPLLVTGLMTVALVLALYPFCRHSRQWMVILIWLLVPLVLHMVLKIRHFRYLYPLVPAVALIISVGLCSLRPRLRAAATALVSLGAVGLWVVCPLAGTRCPGLMPLLLEPFGVLTERPSSSVAGYLLGCGDHAWVSPSCHTPEDLKVLVEARNLVTWIQDHKRSESKTILYYQMGVNEYAHAVHQLQPTIRLTLMGWSDAPSYPAGKEWERFVLLPREISDAELDDLEKRRELFLFQSLVRRDRQDGKGEVATPRWFLVVKLKVSDPWPPRKHRSFLDPPP